LGAAPKNAAIAEPCDCSAGRVAAKAEPQM
jgi:hypothetical protein